MSYVPYLKKTANVIVCMFILEIKHSLQDLLSYGCNWKFSVKTAVICVEILIQCYGKDILIHN